MVLFGEGHIDVEFVADVLSCDLVFKSINEGMGTELQLVVLALSAVKCNAVAEAFVVNHRDIADFRRAVLHRNGTGILLAGLLEFLLDFLVAYFGSLFLNAEIHIFAERYLGADRNDCGENEGLALLDLFHVNFRLGNHIQCLAFFALKRILIRVRDHAVCRIVVKHFRTVHPLNDASRHFAFSEALDLNFVPVLQVSLLHRVFKVFGTDFDGQLYHVVVQSLNIHLFSFLLTKGISFSLSENPCISQSEIL